MFCYAPLHVGCDPCVQTVVAALNDVYVPGFCCFLRFHDACIVQNNRLPWKPCGIDMACIKWLDFGIAETDCSLIFTKVKREGSGFFISSRANRNKIRDIR